MQIHVANILHRSHFGGAQWRVVWVGEKLSGSDIKTTVIFPKDDDENYENFLIERDFSYIRTKMSVLRSPLKLLANFKFLISLPIQVIRFFFIFRKAKFDLLHVNGITNIPPVIAGLLYGKPVLWHWNDTMVPRWIAVLICPLTKLCWLVVASEAITVKYNLTQSNLRYMGVLPPPLPDVVLPKVIDPSQRLNKLIGGSVIIGFVGNILRAKGVLDLINVVAQLRSMGVDAKAVLIGGTLPGHEEFEKEVSDKIKAMGLSNHVTFLGYQRNVDIFIKQFDLLLFPSHTEAAPIVVLQAVRLGVPIVSTPVGNVPELAKHGGILLVPIGSVNKMVDACLEIISMNALARKIFMRDNQDQVSSTYSLSAVANSHCEIYSRLVMI